MYNDILPVLRCPRCQDELTPAIHDTDNSGEIMAATLTCRSCRRVYSVRHGIADFLGRAQPPTPAQRVNEWSLTAWAYERWWRPFSLTLLSGEHFPYRRELPLLARLAGAERGGIFLDIACSNGLYARAITRAMRGAVGHVLGLDHSMAMLIEARRRARTAGLRISYACAEAQALPVATAAVAGAAIGGSINEIGDLDQCLNEARRTLGLGGRFAAMALVRAQSAWGRATQAALTPGGVVFPTATELDSALRRAGLEPETQEQHRIVVFVGARVRSEKG